MLSERYFKSVITRRLYRLNPYSIGPCSPRETNVCVYTAQVVLILILLDHALRDWVYTFKDVIIGVLILILLDHALRDVELTVERTRLEVLILILLDHALRDLTFVFTNEDDAKVS